MSDVPFPAQPSHPYSPPDATYTLIASISHLNDSGTFMAELTYAYDIPPAGPGGYPGVDFQDQAVVWNNTQTDPTQPPSFVSTVLAVTDAGSVFGPSNSGAYALGDWSSFEYYSNSSAPPFVVGFNPTIDIFYPEGPPGWGGPIDNSGGFWSYNGSTPHYINRSGDIVGESSQDTSVSYDSYGDVIFSNQVQQQVFWQYGSSSGTNFDPVVLPFSWTATCCTDSTTPIYAGWDYSATPSQGHLYDNSQPTPDADLGAFLPNGISTPTDPDQTQVIATSSQGDAEGVACPYLFEKETIAPNASPTWMTSPWSINDLLPAGALYQLTTASSINNGGAIVGTATYSGSNTNIAKGSHGVMLVPYDIDVDADNTTPASNYPDPTQGDLGSAEKAAEYSTDATNYPGVGVYENLFDAYNNGVAGYADGIDKFGNGRANACWAFTPMLIDCGSLQAFPNAQFIFKYSASDPNQMTTSGSGDATQYVLPDSGVLRIWKKDGPQIREPQTVDSSGDFVQTNQPYTSQQLGWQTGDKTIRLYIEAVKFEKDQSFNVEVDFYPLGTTHPESMTAKTFRVCPRYVSFENPGAD